MKYRERLKLACRAWPGPAVIGDLIAGYAERTIEENVKFLLETPRGVCLHTIKDDGNMHVEWSHVQGAILVSFGYSLCDSPLIITTIEILTQQLAPSIRERHWLSTRWVRSFDSSPLLGGRAMTGGEIADINEWLASAE